MPIYPVQFAQLVSDQFLRYIFSELPLSDPPKETQAKELLQPSSSLDIPLVNDAYLLGQRDGMVFRGPAVVDDIAGEAATSVDNPRNLSLALARHPLFELRCFYTTRTA